MKWSQRKKGPKKKKKGKKGRKKEETRIKIFFNHIYTKELVSVLSTLATSI